MGLLDKLFDPGKKDRQAANAAAQGAKLTSGQTAGPGGLSAGFAFDKQGRASTTSDLGGFSPMLEQLMAQSSQGFGQSASGLPPELMALFGGAISDVGTPNLQGSDFSQQISGLSQLFGSQLGTATADPWALGAGVTERLNKMAEAPERDLVNQKFQTLFGAGRAKSSAGYKEATQLQDQLSMAGTQRDLAGLQAGQNIQQNALGALFGASQGLGNVFGQQFGQQLSGQQLLSQFANQRFGMGQQQQLLQNQMQNQGFQQGLQGAGAAQNLAQLPLAFQQMLLSAQGLKSNADLGVASNFQQSAAGAKSPLVEGLNTIGQFMGNVKPGGV